MPSLFKTWKLDKSAGPLRRALQYAFYDWTREMPRSKRIITYVGIILQGYALYFIFMWAFMLPKWAYSYLLVLPRRPFSYVVGVPALLRRLLRPEWNADFGICSQDTP